MTTISDQQLREDPAGILRRVAAGESFDITDDGVVVAVIAPKTHTVLDKLRSAGRASPARTPRSQIDAIVPQVWDVTSEEIIRELRHR